MAGELLSFPHDIAGLALSLEEDQVGAVILGDYTELKEGQEVKRTGQILSVPVGTAMIGRVVNALGHADRRQGPYRHQRRRFPWSVSLPESSTASRYASPWRRASRLLTP